MLLGIDIGSDTLKGVVIDEGGLRALEPMRLYGKPLERAREFLEMIGERWGAAAVRAGITGSGGKKLADLLGIPYITEVECIVKALDATETKALSVIEIGAETQKYISLERDAASGRLLLEDVVPSGKCAGGSGSFLDYMYRRLKYGSIEEFIHAGLGVESPAGISGRCAVFAESDIVHHYQKGTPKERIVAGTHQAVARNFCTLIRKSRIPRDRVIAFLGGVSLNRCIRKYLVDELALRDDQIIVPDHSRYMGAHGAALLSTAHLDLGSALEKIESQLDVPFHYEGTSAIGEGDVRTIGLRDEAPPQNISVPMAALGVDIGSVSTKAALIAPIEGEYRVLASHYRRTEGNPVEAVKATLRNIRQELDARGIVVERIVAGTTGSGRYLTGYFIGAETVRDEITAQAAGTATCLKEKEISIIEIGGQDSKYIQIRDGAIQDFEMNWACAAGTGALIEKHSKNLNIPIEEFGDYALRGEMPPIINSTCAVFSEVALLYFQQNNVSTENLCAGACLASAHNYMVKVARNRTLDGNIVFQGAVAFNKGMVKAFERLVGKPVAVPPYPHLTGAIGIARLAFEHSEKSAEAACFRGFDTILEAEYENKSFTCGHCANECTINAFQVGNEKFFQGDRCDRYSSAHKKKKGADLPDYFRERDEIVMRTYTQTAPANVPQVGIPRGLFFTDYFPFFKAVFTELGFEVVTSDPTCKRIIQKGLQHVVAEPCFPIKVLHGHVAELLEKSIDYLFIPGVFTADEPCGNFDTCLSCPYVQSAPDVIKGAFRLEKAGVKVLSPTIYFDKGFEHLSHQFGKLARSLNRTKDQVRKALEKALAVHASFKKTLRARADEILRDLDDGRQIFVVVGRPYAIHDPAINMDIAKKIRDEGFIAIPHDFLPFDGIDVSDAWPNVFTIQGQKKLSAARYMRTRPSMHALVLTYFGCGPDAFLDQMFNEELGRHFLTMQIDEHTSDTGVVTRLQAYLSSARGALGEARHINTSESSMARIRGKRLWLPFMSGVSHVLAAVLRAHGIDAQVLPQSPDTSLGLARTYVVGDVCIPMLYTTEDMLYRAVQADFNPEKESFFQGKSGGPCRYGFYYMIEKFILDRLKGPVDFVTLSHSSNDGGLGALFTLMGWDCIVAHDMLEKLLLHTRPYETVRGESQALFHRYLDELCRLAERSQRNLSSKRATFSALCGTHLGEVANLLASAAKDFEAIPGTKELRPLVGVVGEFFVRAHEPSNRYLVRTLESLGAEVWIAPSSEFLGYFNYITGVRDFERFSETGRFRHYLEGIARTLIGHVAMRDEKILFTSCGSYIRDFHEISPKEMVEMGKKYINYFFGGEAICSMGKSEDFASRELAGIVSAGPFNCMPSLVVSALSRELRARHGNIPFLNLDFDGFEDNTRDQRITTFMAQVRQRHSLKRGVLS